jgi:hypothetical protein
MHCHFLLLVGLAVAVAPEAGGQPSTKQVLAGWPGIFLAMSGYQRSFLPPVVEGDKKNPIYRQTAKYEWTGGAIRLLEATVARDPAFKQRYSAEETGKDKLPPKVLQVADHRALLWIMDGKDAKEPWPLRARLVVILEDDRVLILEFKGRGPWPGKWEAFADKFDLKKIKAALEQPPRTGSPRTLESFRQLKKGMAYAEVTAWVGDADKDVGSGIHIMSYTLDDGAQVLLGFPDFQKLIYVKHHTKDGKVTDLVD